MLTACSHCHTRFRAPDDASGKAAHCRSCGERFLIEPRQTGALEMVGDEDDLIRSLGIPTLTDLEEVVGPPDVKDPSRASELGHGLVAPPLPDLRPRAQYATQNRARTAVLLMLAWLAILVAYGMWQVRAATLALPENSVASVGSWLRVWRPLIYYTVIVVLLSGGLFWLAARIVAHVMRWRYGSAMTLESVAVAMTPLVLPMFVSMAFGSADLRVVIPATAGAFTAAGLMVPGFFGFPLARGLAAAAICLAAALPGYLLGTWTYTDMRESGIRADDARIAAVNQRQKQYALEAATQPAVPASGQPALTPSRTTVEDTIEQAKQMFQYQTVVPAVPPPVMVESSATQPFGPVPLFPTPPMAPVATESPPVVVTPRVPPAPSVAVEQLSSGVFAPWSQGGRPFDLVWRQGGSSLATVSIDTLGNHLLTFWSAQTLERLGAVRVGGGAGISYAICPEGQTFVKIVDGIVPMGEVWSIPDEKRISQFALSPDQLAPVALGFLDAHTAGVLVKTGSDYAVDLLDTKRPSFRKRIIVSVPSTPPNTPSRPFSAANVALSDDGKSIAVVTNQFRLHLVDTATGMIRQQWPLSVSRPEGVEIRCIAFSPDGSHIAVLMDDNARSAVFAVSPGSTEITAAGFSEPLWKQANAPKGSSRRPGRAIDWIDDGLLLCNGELLVDLWSGSVVESLHPRRDDKPRAVAPTAQFPLADGSFLLMYDADRSQIQRLQIDNE